jgi:hypothetical protein
MTTPNWMIEGTVRAPWRARSVRHKRRSTDRRSLNVLDIALAFAVMVLATWGIIELNSLLLH